MAPAIARLKRAARPLVSRCRHLLRLAAERVRPARAWAGRHDPVFEHFEPWRGESDGRFMIDFLGVRTDPRYRRQWRPTPAGPVAPRRPAPYAGYFELAAVLESVVEARDATAYTIVELGAGFGPWLAIAHRAMERLGGPAVRLVGVEMVPEHFQWMLEHLRRNGIDPERHRLLQAAASDREGQAAFLAEPDPDHDFGQRLWRRDGRHDELPDAVGVRTVTLAALLHDIPRVNLLHVDVQGEELRILRQSLDVVNERVERMVVATHSRGIHRRLRALLAGAGWRIDRDFPGRGRRRTEFGDVRFLDGLLVLTNRRRGNVQHEVASAAP